MQALFSDAAIAISYRFPFVFYFQAFSPRTANEQAPTGASANEQTIPGGSTNEQTPLQESANERDPPGQSANEEPTGRQERSPRLRPQRPWQWPWYYYDYDDIIIDIIY